jgi:hypothetical protein
MAKFGAISRRDLIDYLRQYGFDGPYSGGKHQFLIKDNLVRRLVLNTQVQCVV